MASAIGRRPSSVKYQGFDDTSDPTVPLHNDRAFLEGICFRAKYIGSLEVAKPQSRPEIISIMRRIRYENKARGMEKVKCDMRVAVSGLRVTKRQKRKHKQRHSFTPAHLLLESPIYRIFFVAHDCLNKLIFSMICRAVIDDKKVFICAVFKAFKKSHAARIVRSIGQVFEVCCRLQEGPDAANIPGLLPPDKLKAIRLKEAEARLEQEEGEFEYVPPVSSNEGQVNVALGFPPATLMSPVNVDSSKSIPLPGEMQQLVSVGDDYQFQVLEYNQQNYSQQQEALAQMAAHQQSTEERNLLQQFNLTPQQQQAMVLKYSVPGRPFTSQAFGSGLPSHPPNSLGFTPEKTYRPTNVTRNQMVNDSIMSALSPGAAAATDTTDGPGVTTTLVDVSWPDGTEEHENPFTDNLDLKGKDESEQVRLLYEMQRAQASQLQLLKDQLSSETSARINAQAQVHHIMRQNNELRQHITLLTDELKRVKTSPGSAGPLLTPPPLVQPSVAQQMQRSPSPHSTSDSMSAETEESYAIASSTEPGQVPQLFSTPVPTPAPAQKPTANGDQTNNGETEMEHESSVERFSPFGFQSEMAPQLPENDQLASIEDFAQM